MSEGPVFTQRKGGGAAVNEVKMRRAGERGVVIDFTNSLAERNPLAPTFDETELPPEVLIPDRREYLMVHMSLTFTAYAEGPRRWTVVAETYPRFKTIDGLRKLDERLPDLEAWMMELANHPTFPARQGSRVTLIHFIRKDPPPTELPEHTLMHLDWSMGLRAERASQVARRERAMEKARARAMEPVTEVVVPPWKWLEHFPWLQSMLTRTVTHPPTYRVDVPAEEEAIEVPEMDPWQALFLELAESRRVPRVERALESMYKLLVIEQEGGLPKLRAQGLDLMLAKTRLANPDAPLSDRLWGKAGGTFVQQGGIALPPVKLV